MKKRYIAFLFFYVFNVPLHAQSLIASAGNDRTICVGGTVDLVSTVSGGSGTLTYTWTPASGLNNATIPNPVAHPSLSTNYILKVVDSLGNMATDTVKITLDSNLYRPTIGIQNGINPFCDGSLVELVSSPAVSYQWSNGTINSFLVVTQTGPITVTATRTDGCSGTSLPFMAIMQPRTPAPEITPSGDVSVCTTLATLVARDTESGVTYDWSTGETIDSIVVVTPGVYSVIATGVSGCASLPVSKTVIGKPTGFITSSGNQTICENDSIQLTIHTAPENMILWSNGATSMNTWVKDSGNYSAYITTPAGCNDNGQNAVTVTVIQKPLAPVVLAGGSTSFCEGGSVTLFLQQSDSALTYSWDTGITGDSIQVTASGTYKVRSYNWMGCAGDMDSMTVVVYPRPTGNIQVDGSLVICQGDSVRLAINSLPTVSYLWTNGLTTPDIWIKEAGTYYAQITSEEGCSNATSNTVSVSVKTVTYPVVKQTGNHLSASPATPAYQWFLNGTAISGAISQGIDIAEGGRYRVQATANGCSASDSINAIFHRVMPEYTYQVYPNPVINNLNIIYSLKEAQKVTITLHDMAGQYLMHLVDHETQTAGEHYYSLKAAAIKMQKGLYFIEFDFDGRKVSHRFMVL